MGARWGGGGEGRHSWQLISRGQPSVTRVSSDEIPSERLGSKHQLTDLLGYVGESGYAFAFLNWA